MYLIFKSNIALIFGPWVESITSPSLPFLIQLSSGSDTRGSILSKKSATLQVSNATHLNWMRTCIWKMVLNLYSSKPVAVAVSLGRAMGSTSPSPSSLTHSNLTVLLITLGIGLVAVKLTAWSYSLNKRISLNEGSSSVREAPKAMLADCVTVPAAKMRTLET